MIIKRSDFNDLNFTQTENSCVLASYGVCAYPFLHRDIEEYFQGYCEHFGLGHLNKTHEKLYDEHFHAYYRQQRISEYSIIECLHNTSQVQIFKDCRTKIRLRRINENWFEELKTKVDEGERVMLMFFVNECCNLKVMHSVAIGYDDHYFMFDTNPNQGLRELDIDGFSNRCILGETFLIEEL